MLGQQEYEIHQLPLLQIMKADVLQFDNENIGLVIYQDFLTVN